MSKEKKQLFGDYRDCYLELICDEPITAKLIKRKDRPKRCEDETFSKIP